MQTHAFDDALTALARGRVRLPSMPGQSEAGTCRERTDGQWHGEIDTIMWSMAGVLPFHASRCIRKRKAFAQSTPGSNSRRCLGSWSLVLVRTKSCARPWAYVPSADLSTRRSGVGYTGGARRNWKSGHEPSAARRLLMRLLTLHSSRNCPQTNFRGLFSKITLDSRPF